MSPNFKLSSKVTGEENWFSKNIRPMLLIYWTIVFTALIFLDGKVIHIREPYFPIIEMLLVGMYLAYFGGRSFEKIQIYRANINSRKQINSQEHDNYNNDYDYNNNEEHENHGDNSQPRRARNRRSNVKHVSK